MTENHQTETQPKSDRLSTNEWLDVENNRDLLWSAIVELGSVNKAAAQLKLHRPTIYLRAQKDGEFEKELLAAEATNLRQLVDECIAIADDATRDTIVVDGHEETNHEVIQRSRLRIETRIRLAGKLIPHLYGDKPAQVTLHNTVQAVLVSDEQRQHLIELRQKLGARLPTALTDAARPLELTQGDTTPA